MRFNFTCAILCAAVAVQAYAVHPVDQQMDSLIKDHKIIYFGDKDSVTSADKARELIYNFYYDQFRHFQDPAAPYFLFMSKGSDLAMGVGGCVRMRGYYDWGGAIPSPGFAPMLIPMTPDPLNKRKLGTTPAGSALFFRVIGRNKTLGNYQLYIEANFNGYQSRDFHLKKAYAIINDWTIGYANSTFSDPSALPPEIDAQGPNVKMSNTAVLVRWMHTWRSRWTVAASVETPSQSELNTDIAKSRSQYVPDIATFVQYQWDCVSHVRLAGIVRQLPYRDMQTARNYNICGWGVQFSSVFRPFSPVTVYATVNGGKGYAGLGGDLMIGNYDIVSDPERPGRAYAPASWGYFVGLQYNIRPDLFISTTFGQARYLPSKAVAPDGYKYGLYSATNIFWNLTPRIQAGAEFNWGMRKNFNGDHRAARRIGLMAQFSF